MCDRFLYPDDSQGLRSEMDIVKSEPMPEISGDALDQDARENRPTHNFSLVSRGSALHSANGETMLFAEDTRLPQQSSPVVTHQAIAAQARAAVAADGTPVQKDRRTLRKRSYKGYAKDSPPEATPKAKYDPNFNLTQPVSLEEKKCQAVWLLQQSESVTLSVSGCVQHHRFLQFSPAMGDTGQAYCPPIRHCNAPHSPIHPCTGAAHPPCPHHQMSSAMSVSLRVNIPSCGPATRGSGRHILQWRCVPACPDVC